MDFQAERSAGFSDGSAPTSFSNDRTFTNRRRPIGFVSSSPAAMHS
jgi:hypothetical protein